MKNIVIAFVILFFLGTASCGAQQLVQTHNDAYKLKENEQQFLKKPLKNLLLQIKPEIKMVLGTVDYPSYFMFKFVDIEEFRSGKALKNKFLTLSVYVKEPLDWDFDKRPKGKGYEWTKEDVEKYGNLTVIRIKVSGKD